MKRMMLVSLICVLSVGFGFAAFADVTIVGTFSGSLMQNYLNATYEDMASAQTALGYISTTYGATSVDRSFEIQDTYDYSIAGSNGSNPVPNSLDWMRFQTVDNATGNWVYNDLAYEKRYGGYVPGPGKLTGTSSVDFATGVVNIYNYLAYAGNRNMTHEVGAGGDWVNTVGASTTNGNYGVKMETIANFGTGVVQFDGHGAYSPSQADVDALNNNSMGLVGNFNGVVIGLVGNAYQIDHNGTKGAGWYFGINN